MLGDLTGRLLVASPLLLDPNFHRSVVLVCAHGPEGAFGLVLNRALAVPVGDPLPAWAGAVCAPPVVFLGGPVSPARAVGLALLAPGVEGAPGVARVTGRVGLLDLEREPSSVGAGVEQVRVFIGHAGWGAGQLESELLGEAWFVVDALPGDAFAPEPEGLWGAVLRRQRGDLSMLAHFPPDVGLN